MTATQAPPATQNGTEPHLTGWALIRSPLPEEAKKPIHKSVYGGEGLTDIGEPWLIERLHDSGLAVLRHEPRIETIGKETAVRKRGEPEEYEVQEWVVTCDWQIDVDGSPYYGSGAHQDVRLDVARKGAKTSAFKDLVKHLGIGLEVRKGQSDIPGSIGEKSRNDSLKLVLEAAKDAWPAESQFPACPNHGALVVRTKKNGEPFLACPQRDCNTTFWPNQLPAKVMAAMVAALAPKADESELVGEDIDPEEIPF
jgi:hypothetical protein